MSDILTRYDTSLDGLSSSEVEKRQKEYGLNEIAEKPPTPLYILFLSQFVDILIGLLIVAAVAAYAIGDVIDAGVIILAVMLNVIMGFIQDRSDNPCGYAECDYGIYPGIQITKGH